MLVESASAETDGGEEARLPANRGREKAKGKSGTTSGQVPYYQVPADASVTPVKKDIEGILPGPNEAGDTENGNEVLEMYSIQSGGRVKKNKKGKDAKIPDELPGEVDAEVGPSRMVLY